MQDRVFNILHIVAKDSFDPLSAENVYTTFLLPEDFLPGIHRPLICSSNVFFVVLPEFLNGFFAIEGWPTHVNIYRNDKKSRSSAELS